VTIQDRDKRALAGLGVVLLGVLVYWISTSGAPSPGSKIVAAADTVDRAEKRLANLRATLATVDGKEALLKQASLELAEREQGLVPGDTANQAQAQLLQIVRRVAEGEKPPITVRQSEFGQPRAYGDFYGAVSVSITLDCRTDELVNLLAGLSQQPEIISTDEIRFGQANPKTKSIATRVTISGLVPRRLVPQKKELSF
jgi:hypothetical protein